MSVKKVNDAAVDDFKKAISLVEQIRQIVRKYARKIDSNALFAYCDKIEDKLQYYINNANRGWYDSANSLDKAIKSIKSADKKTADGMFTKLFNEITRGADVKAKRGLEQIKSAKDLDEIESITKTYENELRNSLERLMQTYNVATSDYNQERNKILEIMSNFNKQAFRAYQSKT